MTDAEYEQLLEKTVVKLAELASQKAAIETEVSKLQQFTYATANLLSDAARKRFEEKWLPYIQKTNTVVASLTESVRSTLRGCYPKALTATQMRDQLRIQGFDFSSYTSDPLPSVSTTLRRLKDAGEIECEEFEGVAVYRAKPVSHLARKTFGQRIAEGSDALERAAKLNKFYGKK